MRLLTNLSLPPALAALALVLVEWARTAFFSDTRLGGVVPGFAMGLAIVGLLGLPLWGLGLGASLTWKGVGRGWSWGRGDQPAPSAARRVAWVIFGVVALAILVMVVQVRTVAYIKAFKRHVYQGLAAGLTAAVVVCALAMIAGPVVGALTRLLDRLSPKLPAWLDPTRRAGAVAWAGAFALAGAFLAPVLVKALHTVDLRPARLVLLWVALLFAAHMITRHRVPRPATTLALALGVPSLGVIGLVWSAGSLGDSPSRVVALERDTLLTGKLAGVFRGFTDGDGDGVASSFAGGDCDDSDPKVRPGVYDSPGDGVDQNCTGADLDLNRDPLFEVIRAAPRRARKDWNVLLITVDALREDVVGPFFMPNLSAFAEAEAVNYTDAYSAGASTYWSVAALMTSNMPSRVRMGGDQTPIPQERLLTEVLRAADWHTALFANVTVFFVRGLRQAMDYADYKTSDYTVHGAKPGSAHMTDGILKHLRRWKDKKVKHPSDRFFLWGHYYDPHDPYFEVPGYPAADSSDEARYRAICQYTDAEIFRLIEALKEEGLYERTLIIITADHGDEFLEHGHRFHGSTLYEEMVHVPLIMRVPGVPARVLETPISHIEVAPTVLDLLGVDIPQEYVGRSRAEEILTGAPAAPSPVWFEVLPDRNYKAHQVGVRLGQHKLIYRLDSHTFELFDLKADPHEHQNRFGVDDSVGALQEALMRYADHHLYALGQGWSRATKPEGSPKRPAKRKRPPPYERPAAN